MLRPTPTQMATFERLSRLSDFDGFLEWIDDSRKHNAIGLEMEEDDARIHRLQGACRELRSILSRFHGTPETGSDK